IPPLGLPSAWQDRKTVACTLRTCLTRGNPNSGSMEIKIECGCGTRFKFDVEPVYGRMPVPVQCPCCGCDTTTDANQILARKMPDVRPSASPAPIAKLVGSSSTQEPIRVATPSLRV